MEFFMSYFLCSKTFPLVFKFFPKNPGRGSDMLFKIIAERRGVFKAAGKGHLCDGVICGTEHLDSHSQAVPEEVLFGRGIFMFHKYFIQIGPVDSHMSGYIRDSDIIAEVVLDIFFGGSEIVVRVVPAFFRGGILHKRQEQEQVAYRLQLPAVRMGKGSQKTFHTAQESRNIAAGILVDKGI